MITVLLVDDHAGFRGALAELIGLERDLVVCAEAADGHAAVAAARTHCPDVVVMDVGLPGLDGLEATAAIRALGISTRVLVLTSDGSLRVRRDAEKSGAQAFLLKGLPSEDIIAAIRRVAEASPVAPQPIVAPVTIEQPAPGQVAAVD